MKRKRPADKSKRAETAGRTQPPPPPDEVVVEAEVLQVPQLQQAPGDRVQPVVVQQQLGQRGGQPQEGHPVHAVVLEPVVGQVQRVQARLQVGEHVAGDQLDLVVVQGELAEASGQEGGHVDQLVVGQVQGLQLPGAATHWGPIRTNQSKMSVVRCLHDN